MTERKPRGPYAKTAERRAAVARAALDIVMEKGHSRLTTAEVAVRAGMSERAMLYHFPTRDHVLIAALELSDEISVVPPEARGQDELDAIPAFVARDSQERTHVIRLFSYLSAAAQDADHPARDYLRSHNEMGIARLAAGVRRRQEAGLAHPDIDPETAGRQMLAAWNGLQAQWLVDESFDLPGELGQAFRRLTGQPTMEVRGLIDDLLTRI